MEENAIRGRASGGRNFFAWDHQGYGKERRAESGTRGLG